MKAFRRYLLYRLEGSVLRSAIFTILSVIITQSVISECIDDYEIQYNETGIYMLAVVLGIICTLIPILELSGFKNRRNLDTLYFFPIKREKMAAAHFVSGFLQVIVIYSITFFTAYGYLSANTDYFALQYMMLYYVLSILLGFVMYSVFSFLFIQANTVADGVLFCILWIFVLSLIGYNIQNEIVIPLMTEENEVFRGDGLLSEWGIIYAPINNLTVIFQDLIEVNKIRGYYYYSYADVYREQAYMFFAWGAVGIASAVGYFVTFVKRGAEKVGEISDSFFGFRTLIPVYGYMLLMFIGTGEPILTVLIFAMMVIGYIIYRRGFRFKTSDLVLTGCGILAVILGNLT